MTCGVESWRRRPGPQIPRADKSKRWALEKGYTDALQSFSAPGIDPALEINGTWDFKWPLGTKIRVAFQSLPDEMGVSSADFGKVKAQVRELAGRWKLPKDSGVSLEFLDGALFPPLGEAISQTDQHRSPFLKNTPVNVPYDVLVSFEDLPVYRVDPFRGAGAESEELVFPVSDLGSYARRSDYGAPTIYIGRFGRFKSDYGSLKDFYDSDIGQHIVVHEFGHVLGLPHLHQHPDLIQQGTRPSFYNDPFRIMETMERQLGIEVSRSVVNGHLIEAWRGSKAYSDWVDLSQEVVETHKETGTLCSVMTLPNYPCLIRGSACRDLPDLPKQIYTHPQDLDEEAIRLMYDPA